MGTGEFTAGGNPSMDYHPIQGGVEILLAASCYGNRDKLRTDGPLSEACMLNLPSLIINILYTAFLTNIIGANLVE